MAKEIAEKENLGRVVLFRNFLADKPENFNQGGGNEVFEILPVTELGQEHIVASDKYVLPTADAKILNSSSGLVYAYNVSLPYLQEIEHLAQVEKNIVIGQAYLYAGRNVNSGKPSLFQWALVIFVFLMGLVAILAK